MYTSVVSINEGKKKGCEEEFFPATHAVERIVIGNINKRER